MIIITLCRILNPNNARRPQYAYLPTGLTFALLSIQEHPGVLMRHLSIRRRHRCRHCRRRPARAAPRLLTHRAAPQLVVARRHQTAETPPPQRRLPVITVHRFVRLLHVCANQTADTQQRAAAAAGATSNGRRVRYRRGGAAAAAQRAQGKAKAKAKAQRTRRTYARAS